MPPARSNLLDRHLRRSGRRRRGSVKAGVVLTLIGGGILGGTAIAVRPRPIGAAVPIEAMVGAERAVAVESLAGILRRSAAILAVHRRGSSPFTDVVVHAFDGPRPGVIEPSEILVLTHSRTLRAVMAFTHDPTRSGGEASTRPIPRAALEDPGFARSWRDRPDVRRDVLPAGTDLVDLRLDPAEGPGNGAYPSWTLCLTWPDGSADGTITVEVRVDPATDGP